MNHNLHVLNTNCFHFCNDISKTAVSQVLFSANRCQAFPNHTAAHKSAIKSCFFLLLLSWVSTLTAYSLSANLLETQDGVGSVWMEQDGWKLNLLCFFFALAVDKVFVMSVCKNKNIVLRKNMQQMEVSGKEAEILLLHHVKSKKK